MVKDNKETENLSTVKQHHATVAYPLKPTRRLIDLDTWYHLFVMRFFGRSTVYNFAVPPETILDLGCGAGTWAIDAAREFNNATIIGFDLEYIQPPLEKVGFPDLASRVRWVHGNFLDPLPFDADSFDFVRARYIGLGVPENKWQDLLEEISRILKPGGQLEILEEELRFPWGTCHPTPPYPCPPTQNLSQTSHPSEMQSSEADPHDTPSQNSRQPLEFEIDPRDHWRLAESWRAMLQSRFISPQTLSILPFYLDQFFDRVEQTAQGHMRLPPNSALSPEEHVAVDISEGFTFNPYSALQLNVQPNPPSFIKDWDLDPARPTSRSPIPPTILALHLARRVATIVECKEAIWLAYETLYSEVPSVCRLRRPDEVTVRAEFEAYWSNWVDDMTDRMDMRNVTSSALSWPLPPLFDSPTSTAWRLRCGPIDANDPVNDDPDSSPDRTNIFRSSRCFIAWKAVTH